MQTKNSCIALWSFVSAICASVSATSVLDFSWIWHWRCWENGEKRNRSHLYIKKKLWCHKILTFIVEWKLELGTCLALLITASFRTTKKAADQHTVKANGAHLAWCHYCSSSCFLSSIITDTGVFGWNVPSISTHTSLKLCPCPCSSSCRRERLSIRNEKKKKTINNKPCVLSGNKQEARGWREGMDCSRFFLSSSLPLLSNISLKYSNAILEILKNCTGLV